MIGNAKTLKRLEQGTGYLDYIVADKDGRLYKKKVGSDEEVTYTIEILDPAAPIAFFFAPESLIINSYEVINSSTSIIIQIALTDSFIPYTLGTIIPKGTKIFLGDIAENTCVVNLKITEA